ncbi:hypothetical protein COOONC_04362, partial [Cooperia oncophora]
METSAPVASDAWSYLKSASFFRDLIDVAQRVKKSIVDTGYKMFYTRCERRVAAAQKKDRPDLEKIGWDSQSYAKTFKLPPLEDKMVRVNGKTTTVEEFREKYEKPRIPCVITGLTDNWKAKDNWQVKVIANQFTCTSFTSVTSK